MMNLRYAMRPALEQEVEIEPFEDVAGEDLMDHFEFDIAPIAEAVSLEGFRPYSRRHRVATEAARISMEEEGIGFWALLATAVAAAIVALFSMISWFTGGSSGGGGGGGGGGGSLEKMSDRAKGAEPAATAARENLKTILHYAR